MRRRYLRVFTPKMKVTAYEKQKGICPACKKHFDFAGMEGDHIIAWRNGGKTVPENCQMLCYIRQPNQERQVGSKQKRSDSGRELLVWTCGFVEEQTSQIRD